MTESSKDVYVVLGMPRSGTSVVTRSLAALGIHLGDNLQIADERNPRGFYEDLDFMYTVNRGVSKAIDHEWMPLDTDPGLFDSDKALKDFKHYAVGLLCEKLAVEPTWGFKDARTTTILPFWQSVFKAVAVKEHYVIVVRHPLAAAYSLQKFAHVDLVTGFILWVKFFSYSLAATENKNRVVVSYDEMLSAPETQLKRMHHRLDLQQPLNEDAVLQYVSTFLDRNIKRHDFTDEDLILSPAHAVVPVCAKLYQFAMLLAQDKVIIDSEAYHRLWQDMSVELARVQPMLDYIEAKRMQYKKLERRLRTVRKSLPFKLIYPLRVIDDYLRVRRNKDRRKLVVNNAK